ncbi:membrane protein [Gordonia phage DatBoi]|nr:membrane protein [Gordonia phage DatBoi]
MSAASTARKFRRSLFWGAILVTALLGAANLGGADMSLWVVFAPIYAWVAFKIVLNTVFGFLVGIYVRTNNIDELAKILDAAAKKRRR